LVAAAREAVVELTSGGIWMVAVEKGQSVRIETQKQVIEIRDFAGLGVCTLRYFAHPALEFAAYRPPYWAKGQGNRPVFEFYLDVPAVVVDEESSSASAISPSA
jgi:hypothetical protein